MAKLSRISQSANRVFLNRRKVPRAVLHGFIQLHIPCQAAQCAAAYMAIPKQLLRDCPQRPFVRIQACSRDSFATVEYTIRVFAVVEYRSDHAQIAVKIGTGLRRRLVESVPLNRARFTPLGRGPWRS